ncbi:GNAT family N-acetyltransferase [Sulfurospirillum halorespirans]|uniref:Putative regulatory protein n=1 Tax=Sulfurospirillum halorespirans DSM 13726 TaxID=1193502 RepID=A0A1D7THJ7_9BACT|nr:GNAT family N-acetyltransferase [Sulfurospirillum halorespirans]AOO64314.1 putative regulatory protein [Sulfurospirillum halorespirans DSM 13726]
MIREASVEDTDVIVHLLEQLGYADTSTFMHVRIQELLKNPDALLFCYESEGKVVALLSLHVIPQIALLGSFLRISYFVVEEETRSLKIGAELEALASRIAKEKGCDRIEVHCHERRKDAHRFYERHGFVESPKYFVKHLF